MKQANLIYPCGFEIFDPDKKEEQERGINETIKNGYMPIYIFNNDANNVKNLIPIKFKPNIEKHPAYHTWISLLMRCYDTEHPQYKNEGALGAEVILPWIGSFERFCKDMEITPNMV